MTRCKTWTLTDVAGDVWLDSFGVAEDALRLGTPHAWSVRKRTLRGGLRDGADARRQAGAHVRHGQPARLAATCGHRGASSRGRR